MIKPIIQKGNQLLRERSAPVEPGDATVASAWQDLDDTLAHQMTLHNFTRSAGLSGVQIGYLLRICIVQLPDKTWRSIANPEITVESAEEVLDYEGCLSFFDKRGLVPRPNTIRVRYVDRDFAQHEEVLDGWAARIVLHEVDHMDGILYIDRMRSEDSLLCLEEYRAIRNRQ